MSQFSGLINQSNVSHGIPTRTTTADAIGLGRRSTPAALLAEIIYGALGVSHPLAPLVEDMSLQTLPWRSKGGLFGNPLVNYKDPQPKPKDPNLDEAIATTGVALGRIGDYLLGLPPGTVRANVSGLGEEINRRIDTYRDQKGDEVYVVQSEDGTGEIVDPYQIGYDLGTLMNLANSMSTTTQPIPMEEAVQLVAQNYPHLQYLADGYRSYFMANLVKTSNFDEMLERYKRIWTGRKPDGSLITPADMYVDENGDWAWVNEIGQVEVFQGKGGNLPPWPGTVYVGPESPNYRSTPEEPDKGRATGLLDLYCHAHDSAYSSVDKFGNPLPPTVAGEKRGWLNLEGDMRLLARISNNYDNMGDSVERTGAQVAFKYFSGVGLSLAVMKDTLSGDVADTVSNERADDIFSFLIGGNDMENRMLFYQGLRDAVKQDNPFTAASVVAENGTQSCSRNNFALELFDSMLVYV